MVILGFESDFSTLKRWIANIFAYRIPVYILTFLLIVAPFHYPYVVAHPEIIFVALCFSSLMAFIYLFNKVTDHQEDSINVRGGPLNRSTHNPVLVLAFVCLALPLCYLVFFPAYLPWYGVVALLGYFYSKPFPFTRPPLRLKGVVFVKNVTAALGWAIPSSGVYTVVTPGWSPTIFWIHLIEIFCLSLLIELLWDIRDMEGDRQAGVYTMANMFGVLTTQILATLLLGTFLFLLRTSVTPCVLLGIGVFSLVFVWTASPKRGAWFYYAILMAWIGVLGVVFFL